MFFYRLTFPLRFWASLIRPPQLRVGTLYQLLTFGIVFSVLAMFLLGLAVTIVQLPVAPALLSATLFASLVLFGLCIWAITALPQKHSILLEENDHIGSLAGPYRIIAPAIGIGGAWIMFNLLLATVLFYGTLLAIGIGFVVFIISLEGGATEAWEKVVGIWESLTAPKHIFYYQLELFEDMGLDPDAFYLICIVNIFYVILLLAIMATLMIRATRASGKN